MAIEYDQDLCRDKAIAFYQDAIANDKANILGKQFQLTTLKLARASLGESRGTLESTINKLAKSIDPNDPKLKEVDALYKEFGYKDDLKKVLSSMRTTSYWKSSQRFYNEDVSAFILMARAVKPELGLNSRDAAITWFMNSVSDKAGELSGKGSANFNRTNLTSRLIRYTGGLASKRSLTDSEIEREIATIKKDISNEMEKLHRGLVISLGSSCFNGIYFAGSCFYDRNFSDLLFSQSLMDLTKEINNRELQSLEGSITEQAGKYKFQLLELPTGKEYLKETPLSLIPPKLDYTSIADIRIHDHYWVNQSDVKRLEKGLNTLGDEWKIRSFHQHADSETYVIFDKKNSLLKIYYKNGRLKSSTPLDLKGMLGDEKQRGGAGNYFVHSYRNGVLYIQDERGEVRPLEGVNVKGLDAKTPLYILPLGKDHHFKIKGGKMHFTVKGKKPDYAPYNFSKKDSAVKKVRSVITNRNYQTKTAVTFMGEIDKRKKELIKMYSLTNHEYNELSKLAFGILGNESQFGNSKKYWLKEAVPFVVSIAKGNRFNTSSNSRGPTQIKTVPRKIARKYGVTKSNLEDPKKAAVATMGFLAEALSELKSKEKHHPKINSDNRFDYIHYIYMGKSSEITKATATPYKNIYFKQILKYNRGLEVFEKMD